MADHPKRITTEYSRAWKTPEDAIREREDDARKEALADRINQGTLPHEGSAAFAEAFDSALYDAGAVEVTEKVAGAVDQAIAQVVEQAGRKVVAASWSQEEKTAKAFCDELESRGMILGGNGLYIAEDDDEPATYEETLALEAELDDEEIGEEYEG